MPKIGNLVRMSVAFTNAAGAPADPTVVTCRYRAPNGDVTTFTYGVDTDLVKDSTGNYHVDIACSDAGAWLYRFAGTGAVVAADDAEFTVGSSVLA